MRGRDAPTALIVGGRGRVGRMLDRIWDNRPDVAFQSRSTGADLVWDPLQGPRDCLEWIDRVGGCRSMVVLAGVTPTSGTDFNANADLAEACCAVALEAGVDRVLYASTSAVYGPGSGRPFAEDDAPRPVNAYGETKLAGEAICTRYRDRGLDVTSLRIGNIAGTDQLLINAGRATEADPVKLDRFKDGSGPRRSYIGIHAFSSVLDTLFAASDLPDTLNVGAPKPVEMQTLLAEAGTPWEWVPAPDAAIQDVTLDCTGLAAIHDFAQDASEPSTMIAEWRRWRDAP